MRLKDYAVMLLAVLLCCVACYLSGLRRGKRIPQGGMSGKADTVVVYRTHMATAPAFQAQTFQRWAFFTEERTDTVIVREPVPYAVHDTVYVPIVQRYYEELDGRLRLWISGYQPTLDRYELDEIETTVTRRKRWGFSIVSGPTVVVTPFHKCPVDAGWGITAGLSYAF